MKMIRRKLTVGYTLIATSLTLLLTSTGAVAQDKNYTDKCPQDTGDPLTGDPGFVSGSTIKVTVYAEEGKCSINASEDAIPLLFAACPDFLNGLEGSSGFTGFDWEIGTHTVTFKFSSGIIANVDFVVREKVPPVWSNPVEKIEVVAKTPAGAIIDYIPTVTDNCDPSPTIKCTPDLDQKFHLGKTTVTCVATDQSFNETDFSFCVQVDTPQDMQKNVLKALLELKRNSPSSSDLAQIIGSISQLSKAVDMRVWKDGSHPASEALFEAEIAALTQLLNLQEVPTALINLLLDSNKLLTQIAINDAAQKGVDQGTTDKLNNDLLQVATADPVQAITAYRVIWKAAIGAMP